MRMSKQANMLSLPVRSSSKYIYPDFINGAGAITSSLKSHT